MEKYAIEMRKFIEYLYEEGLDMSDVKLKEKPMPVIYTTEDICKIFHIGRVKCLELFHRADFPAQKYGRGFWIEANALTNYMSSRQIIC